MLLPIFFAWCTGFEGCLMQWWNFARDRVDMAFHPVDGPLFNFSVSLFIDIDIGHVVYLMDG